MFEKKKIRFASNARQQPVVTIGSFALNFCLFEGKYVR